VAVYVVWFSPIFQIESINVDGAELIDPTKISGPVSGNILFWKPPVLIDEIPQLASLAFEKDIANNSISINVKEREKSIIWCLEPRNECFWADESGFIFTNAPSPDGVFLISVVRDYTERDLNIGDNVLPQELFVNLDSTIRLLSSVDIPIDELRINDLKFKEATGFVSGGPEIYFSLLVDPSFGKNVLEALSTSPEWGRVQYIDLRVENRAYYSL